MVPPAEFGSYYGRPILKRPVWTADIPAYFFLGGLAAGSSLLGAGADLSGNRSLRRSGRLAAVSAIAVGGGLLVHDLGRPARFLNMLRVVRPTSPMSVGTWAVSAYGSAAAAAAGAEVLGILPRVGRAAGLVAAGLAPVVATYTAVLLADTSVPVWHGAYRELPFVFVGSATAAAGGLGLIAVSGADATPARRAAIFGAAVDLAAGTRMEHRMGFVAEPLQQGRSGRVGRWARGLTAAGAVGAMVGGRSRTLTKLSGAALMAGSLLTRFSVSEAGTVSAGDPRYTVIPQRLRVQASQPG
jgi:hypothetical protein